MADSPVATDKPKVKRSSRKIKPTSGTTPGTGPDSTGTGAGTNGTGTGPGPASEKPEKDSDSVSTETIGVNVRTSDKINPLLTETLAAEFSVDISQSSLILVAIFDGLAALLFGDAARMNAAEKSMISEPLERILKRMSPDVTKAVNAWGDYAMLTMGLIAWGSRISRLQREKAIDSRPESLEPAPEKPPASPPPAEDMPIGEVTAAPLIIAAQIYGESL